MTINQSKKVTCFLCRYIIADPQKCKYVIYKNTKKPVCRYCKASNYKVLNKKYSNFDLDCTACKKAVRYNKSRACSICNHFVHARCNYDLTTQDKTNIDKICDFYICKKCNQSTFPQYYKKHTKKKNNKVTKTPNQCFTCTRNIPNYKYYNKTIIYG